MTNNICLYTSVNTHLCNFTPRVIWNNGNKVCTFTIYSMTQHFFLYCTIHYLNLSNRFNRFNRFNLMSINRTAHEQDNVVSFYLLKKTTWPLNSQLGLLYLSLSSGGYLLSEATTNCKLWRPVRIFWNTNSVLVKSEN